MDKLLKERRRLQRLVRKFADRGDGESRKYFTEKLANVNNEIANENAANAAEGRAHAAAQLAYESPEDYS